MKYIIGFKRGEYAWLDIEADSFEEAEKKANSIEIDDTDWEPSGYYDTELFLIEDEDGNQIYYG